MKKYLRAMCLAFAVLMILSAVSCAENSDDENNSAGNDVSQTSESETDAKDLSYVSELPSSVKFDGETVRILSLDSAGLNDELYVEEGNTGNNVNDAVYISHSDCYDDAKFVADLVKERFGIQNILIGDIGQVIGSHTGIGTVALFFIGDSREV